ncbi:uncharacterized protein LOC125665697 [Ostrea edulis]|uniref:uncharacterized protein LOC125665697 n=1 Tax=Ostrea edulis TaxID=37623 RepID=UPI0024AF12DD|nr:uncharacterized protein LOC125665697 [Ostrea edulis]XP_056008365.1 uncharacterized protein LOC125665697 [Ostrea edulis]
MHTIRLCVQCQGNTEFYCRTCKHDLCLQCKEKHVIDLHTKHHDVVIYCEKFENAFLQETCVRHPSQKYSMFCEQCNYSVCNSCTNHTTHALVDLRTTYQTKRQQHREIIDNIRSETLYNYRVLLAGIKTDIKTCPSQICHRQSQMSTKAQRLKDLIDTMVCDSKIRKTLLQHRGSMNRYVVNIQNYENIYEQSANRAVQFLLFVKTNHGPQIKDSPSQLLSVITEIQMTTGKRQVGIDECLRLMSTPVLHTSVSVTGVSHVYHISREASGRVWVCDYNNIILTDTTGIARHRVLDLNYWIGGPHTVNRCGELIYIDKQHNINKRSKTLDNTPTRLLESESPWVPICLHASHSTGDLIVGMFNTNADNGKVTRYNGTGKQILNIQHDNTGQVLYGSPIYITENNNGDVIVSDYIKDTVIGTCCSGRHRFSYKGRSVDPPLRPRGICTDALSNILVCDEKTHTVQMIDKDGQFMSLLLTHQHGINKPWGLDYDDKIHLLWVGSHNTNKVSVYRYIQRRYSLTENPGSDDGMTKALRYEEVQKSEELESEEDRRQKASPV